MCTKCQGVSLLLLWMLIPVFVSPLEVRCSSVLLNGMFCLKGSMDSWSLTTSQGLDSLLLPLSKLILFLLCVSFSSPLFFVGYLPLAQDISHSPDLYFFVDIFKISFLMRGIRTLEIDTESSKADFLRHFLVFCAFFQVGNSCRKSDTVC